ncbi:uncharacterized protein LOC134842818, partial [Symsagittifera roscoffensis]|uniref:uncharacterized protein LOC134842818 n=1 Tax=Symsagittifera roscoffensis TaxID=84072 RepID=UPI00307B45CB
MKTEKIVPFFNWGIVLAICLCWLRNVNGKQDLTMQHNATGCEVAKAAIDKLEQLMEKSIELGYYFQTRDKYMLTRLAFLSEFGETEYRENASGIWQLTRENWEKAQTVVSGTSQVQIGRLIQQQLGFYFHDTTFENQTQPMVNLVAAQIMIEIQAIQSDVVPARIDKNGQWDFWKNATGLSDPDGSLQPSFNQKSDLLDTNSGDGGSECMTCTDPPTDAVFIMDGSGSINDDEYLQQKNFVKAVMNQFEDQMTVGESQVAFVLFNDRMVESSDFSSDKQAADRYIEELGNPNGGTDLDEGLNEGIRIVRESVHSRLNDETVRKFFFFLTDGQGNLTNETVNDLRNLPEVLVYSIGMAGDVDPIALTTVASHENFVKIYETFDEFEADIASILYATCRITSFKVEANYTAYTRPSLMLSE